MKQKAFILTFIAYAIMHTLRTAYSYCKPYFKDEFGLSNTFLALMDSSIYFAMGFGFFFRYFFLNSKDIISSFFYTGIIFIVSFILFPLLAITNVISASNSYFISLTLMIIFGFFQMHYWPVVFIIINDYYTNQEDGGLIGFWSTAANFGNIIGYLFPALLIVNLHTPWQIPELVLAAAALIANFLVFIFVKRKDQLKRTEYQEIQQGNKREDKNQFSILLDTFAECFTSIQNGLLLVSACLYKAIIYTFMLWLPIYIDSLGQKNDSAYISIIFNIANVVGTYFLAKFYEASGQNIEYRYVYLQYLNPALALISIGGMILLITIKDYSFIIYSLIIFAEGFITGGIFNILTGNEMIKLTNCNSDKIDYLTTVIFSTASITIGIASLAIGGFMKGAQADSYEGVFIVLIILSVIGFATIALRSFRIHKNISLIQ